MSRTRQEGSPVESNVFTDNKYRTQSRALVATLAMQLGDPTVNYFSAAAPQIVKLPPIELGMHYVIGALTSTLTIQDSAGVALSPATTIATGVVSAFHAVRIPATGVLTWMVLKGA